MIVLLLLWFCLSAQAEPYTDEMLKASHAHAVQEAQRGSSDVRATIARWLGGDAAAREEGVRALGYLWTNGSNEEADWALGRLRDMHILPRSPERAWLMGIAERAITPAYRARTLASVMRAEAGEPRDILFSWVSFAADRPTLESIWKEWAPLTEGRESSMVTLAVNRLTDLGAARGPLNLEGVRRILQSPAPNPEHLMDAGTLAGVAWANANPDDRRRLLEWYGRYLGNGLVIPRAERGLQLERDLLRAVEAVDDLQERAELERDLIAAIRASNDPLVRRGLAFALTELEPERGEALLAASGRGLQGEPLLSKPFSAAELTATAPPATETAAQTARRLAAELRSGDPAVRLRAARAHAQLALSDAVKTEPAIHDYAVDYLLQQSAAHTDAAVRAEVLRALVTIAQSEPAVARRLSDHFARRVQDAHGAPDAASLRALASVDPERAQRAVENWREPPREVWGERATRADRSDRLQIAAEYLEAAGMSAAQFRNLGRDSARYEELKRFLRDRLLNAERSTLLRDLHSGDLERTRRALMGISGLVFQCRTENSRETVLFAFSPLLNTELLCHRNERIRRYAVEEVGVLGPLMLPHLADWASGLPEDDYVRYRDSLRHLRLSRRRLVQAILAEATDREYEIDPYDRRFRLVMELSPQHAVRELRALIPTDRSTRRYRQFREALGNVPYAAARELVGLTTAPVHQTENGCPLSLWRALVGRSAPL